MESSSVVYFCAWVGCGCTWGYSPTCNAPFCYKTRTHTHKHTHTHTHTHARTHAHTYTHTYTHAPGLLPVQRLRHPWWPPSYEWLWLPHLQAGEQRWQPRLLQVPLQGGPSHHRHWVCRPTCTCSYSSCCSSIMINVLPSPPLPFPPLPSPSLPSPPLPSPPLPSPPLPSPPLPPLPSPPLPSPPLPSLPRRTRVSSASCLRRLRL